MHTQHIVILISLHSIRSEKIACSLRRIPLAKFYMIRKVKFESILLSYLPNYRKALGILSILGKFYYVI